MDLPYRQYIPYMDLAKTIAEASVEEKKVGCIILSKEEIYSTRHIMGYGINRKLKTNDIIHAEVDAINNSIDACVNRKKFYTPEIAIIANKFPCNNCTKKLIEFGIKLFITNQDIDIKSRWRESQLYALETIKSYNLKQYILKEQYD